MHKMWDNNFYIHFILTKILLNVSQSLTARMYATINWKTCHLEFLQKSSLAISVLATSKFDAAGMLG